MDCSDQRFYLDLASVEVLEGSVDATLVQEEWAAVGSVQAQAGGGLIAKDGCNDPLMQLAREGN